MEVALTEREMPASENRKRMTLAEADEYLRNSPAAGTRHIVANEDGSFSVVGQTESEKLADSFYDIVVVATTKKPSRPGDFFDLVQLAAAKPITLRKLIQHLTTIYRPPRTKRDPAMVIRLRTKDAYTKLGYLRRHVNYSRTG
jgi:hypothetical protein